MQLQPLEFRMVYVHRTRNIPVTVYTMTVYSMTVDNGIYNLSVFNMIIFNMPMYNMTTWLCLCFRVGSPQQELWWFSFGFPLKGPCIKANNSRQPYPPPQTRHNQGPKKQTDEPPRTVLAELATRGKRGASYCRPRRFVHPGGDVGWVVWIWI